MTNRLLLLPSALLLLALSCSKNPQEKAFAQLDRALANRAVYVAAFEQENDSLRQALAVAPDDSTRWETAYRLYERYLHFSTDSTARYMMQMKDLALTPPQNIKTQFAEIQVLEWMSDPWQALARFRQVDTTGIHDMGLRNAYLTLGANVYMNNARFHSFMHEEKDLSDSLSRFQQALFSIDTVSYDGKKARAQYLRSQKRYKESLEIFKGCVKEAAGDYHELSSIAYNCGVLCGLLGDNSQKIEWLTKSGIYDMMAPNRDLLSLYELALTLYRDGDLKRAGRYIEFHFNEVFSGHFQPKMIWSSRAYNIIIDASRKAEHDQRVLLWTAIGVVTVLLVIIFLLWIFASRQAAKRAVANQNLETANRALEKSNNSLAEANRIKDNYVFRYMDLSLRYLDQVEERRHEYRQIAKTKGEEALMKELRAPASYAEYKDFYHIFDQTFLGIFPNFVSQVNELLRPDARFDEQACRDTLPTELRILATLKLGIGDSPRIATFLKCSLSTVYTYRAKMRNQAICAKEDFENRIKELG